MSKLLELHNRISALERRMGAGIRHAPVAEVDAEKGLVRLDLGQGDAGPLLSPWIPYGQIAGALKVHTPPTVGQQLTYMSPTGDIQQAIALPMTWSNHNPSPSDKEDENVLTYGDVYIKIIDAAIVIKIGDAFHLSISADGLAMAGGKVAHDEKDIGSTHKHEGVEPGDGISETPVPAGPAPVE